uniref:Uncharacterized protein n=1 Tax=Wuchereria bancrofti TaxID=6293 RepID=A0A1I8EU47_WUCBA
MIMNEKTDIVVTIIILLIGQANGQYGEIASLIGDSLTPGLFGSSASGLAGAASVYQIAQGALQLTGTGVGILNQAAEGKWFNKVVEEARNVSSSQNFLICKRDARNKKNRVVVNWKKMQIY